MKMSENPKGETNKPRREEASSEGRQLSLFQQEFRQEQNNSSAAPDSPLTRQDNKQVGDGVQNKPAETTGQAALKTVGEKARQVRADNRTPQAKSPSRNKTKQGAKRAAKQPPEAPPRTGIQGSSNGFRGKMLDREKETAASAPEKQAQPEDHVAAKEKTVPLEIRFFPGEDEALLKEAKKGHFSPPGDLQLHRQALLFSLSPGFDTLLSLSAARQVETLDYQVNTVRHVLKNLRGRALLCDEVGLGKTIEAGLIMMEYMLRGLVRRVLVLSPPSLVEQWQQEMLYKFNLDFIPYDAPAFKKHPSPWQEFPRIIASLDTAKRENHRKEVLAGEYDLVIVDEAHHMKNHRTLSYQLVKELKKKYILLLTATPVENNLEELFNLITLLAPGQLETASSFKRKYITRGDPLKPKNTEDLKKLVREVMVRNRRSETGAILCQRHAEVLELALSPEEMALYSRMTDFIRQHYRQEVQGRSPAVNVLALKTLQREVGSSMEAVIPTLEKMAGNEDTPPELRGALAELAREARKIPRRAKAEALLKLLQKIPGKVIIFTVFGETQRFLTNFLKGQGIEVAELHGRMRRQEKEDQVQRFAREARVLVSTETGSEGRNLQFCQVMINYDLPWNPMRIEQRIGRIHRLGQTRDVYIYNLSAKGTVESYILELLDAKINMFQLVVGELDMILGSLKEKKDFETMVMDIWSGAQSEVELDEGMQELGEQLTQAKAHYEAVKTVDERLLGELMPEE